ncbi:MAG: zeta toxin family protein [Bacteroidota bacterium]
MPNLYIIAGCNGAGKTTASFTVLPEMLDCREFVNADEIAKGLSPFQPEMVPVEAGRIMIQRVDDLIKKGVDFAFETTLASLTLQGIITKAKAMDYQITLVYIWLNSPELAIERVKHRVAEGGHHIPEDTIRRRYDRGLKNLFEVYMPLSDSWIVVDNSLSPLLLIAKGLINEMPTVFDEKIWKLIKRNL